MELKQGLSGKEVAEKIGCCVDIVYEIAQKNNIDLKVNSHKNLLEKRKSISANSKKENIFLQSFESTAAAAEWCYKNQKCTTLNSGVRSHIAEAANGKRKSAYGYIWKYN